MSELVWKFSPSIIESYFSHGSCLRSLVLSGLDNESGMKFGFEDKTNLSPARAASAGNEWERSALDLIKGRYGDGCVISKPERADDDGNKFIPKFTEEEFASELSRIAEKSEAEGITAPYYIYQAGLNITPEFFKHNLSGVDGEEIEKMLSGDGKFKINISSRTFPDLIRIDRDDDGVLLLSVVDIKLAKKPKLEHKIQVSLYVRLLQEMIKRRGLSDKFKVNTDEAYIFNFGKTAEAPFRLEKVFHFMHRFLNTVIPDIAKYARTEIAEDEKYLQFPYKIGQRCEWCPNYGKCIKACIETGEEIMLLPYMTEYSQNYIRDLKKKSPELHFCCDSFGKFCDIEENRAKLTENTFWKRFLPDKDAYLKMLSKACTDERTGYLMRDTASCEIPASEDVRVILTAQKDEGYGKCWYFGMRVEWSESAEGLFSGIVGMYFDYDDERISLDKYENRMDFSVTVKNMECHEESVCIFLSQWHQIITAVDQYNRVHPEKGLSLQHYVMDNYELKNIEETLFEFIDSEGEDWEAASDIVLLLQGKSLVENTEIQSRPDRTVDFPFTVITSVVSRLFILPAFISYSMTDVCSAFSDGTEGGVFTGVNDERFINKRSNVLKNDLINEYWDKKDVSTLNCIFFYMKNRLAAESLLLQKMRKTNHRGIANKPFPFVLPEKDTISSQEIKMLKFETLYENQLVCQALRSARSLELSRALQDGKLWLLQRTDEDAVDDILRFEILNSENFYGDGFFSAVICRYMEENVNALPFYDDSVNFGENKNRLSQMFPSAEFYNVMFSSIVSSDGKLYFEFKSKPDPENGYIPDEVYPKGAEFILFETLSKINLNKSIEAFITADNPQKSFVLNPVSFYKTLNNDYESAEQKLLEYGKTKSENFTPSQQKTLKQLYEKNITLLLGPPGTGKTNFISRALIALCRYYKDQNKNLKILVSANSHAAIENVLLSVTEMMNTLGLTLKDIDLRKIGGMNGISTAGDIKIKGVSNLNKLLSPEKAPLIVGSTVWKIQKEENIDGKFDLIILDEASQVKTADALIPFMIGDRDKTRYLIVGDENQLPPIISGQYEKHLDKPYLLGSVFRYYYDIDRLKIPTQNSYVKTLTENFRMNNAICDYSAREIYGQNYKAFSEGIGCQNFSKYLGSFDEIYELVKELYPNGEDNEILAKILDPEYPLVLCCVKGETASDIKQKEVEYVTKLVKALQYLLKNKKGEEYSSADFWGKSGKNGCGDCGIVSPHHEHISRLKKEIVSDKYPVSPFGSPETEDDLFIGTVDKLQGQERQSVIVSYGITDVEQALAESEFVFSRNRLNVAITRAKKKCIVFLTDAVLSYPIEALSYDDPELIDGIDYVCGFRDYMKDTSIGNSKSIITNSIECYRKKQS